MKRNYIKHKIEELIETGKEPEYESLSIKDFITELDFATKYLSRLLKVRPFVMRWTPLLGQNRGDIKIGSRYPEVKDSTIPLLVDSTGVDVYTSAGVR